MKSIIKGHYQAHKDVDAVDAEVLVQSGYWIIRYKDPKGHMQQLSWSEAEIISLVPGNTYVLQNNEYPRFISIDQALAQRMKPKSAVSSWFKDRKEAALVGSVTMILVLGMLALWKLVPLVANAIATRIPIETEQKLGLEMQKSFLSQYTVDTALTLLVNEYLDSLQLPSSYDLQLYVVQSDQVNAFAVPGGTIVIFSEILKKMKRHEALAALIGHEATHIEHRHSLKSLARSIAWSSTLSMIIGGSDVISGIMVKNVNNLTSLKYSRSLEHEADTRAVQILGDKRIDLIGMIELMHTLQQIDTSGHAVEFLQTHPLTTHRMEVAMEASRVQKSPVSRLDLLSIWSKIKQAEGVR